MGAANKVHAIVVDDDALVLMHACSILEDAGFVCQDASNGDEAWEMIKAASTSITLLFSDVEMPSGMNGFELARRVSAQYPDIEVVLASGRLRPGPDDLPGNTTFINKPFSAAVVRRHLRSKLSGDKAPPALQADG